MPTTNAEQINADLLAFCKGAAPRFGVLRSPARSQEKNINGDSFKAEPLWYTHNSRKGPKHG